MGPPTWLLVSISYFSLEQYLGVIFSCGMNVVVGTMVNKCLVQWYCSALIGLVIHCHILVGVL